MTKTVMLVDDSPSIRALYSARLQGAGYQVVLAHDGEEAIALLDGRPLGLIVSDLAMPRLDGMGFLRHLRAHPRYRSTPLVLVATENRIPVKEAARRQGAQAFLTKPVTPADLLAAVERLCV